MYHIKYQLLLFNVSKSFFPNRSLFTMREISLQVLIIFKVLIKTVYYWIIQRFETHSTNNTFNNTSLIAFHCEHVLSMRLFRKGTLIPWAKNTSTLTCKAKIKPNVNHLNTLLFQFSRTTQNQNKKHWLNLFCQR